MSIIQINPASTKGKKLLPPQIDISSDFGIFSSSDTVDSDSQYYFISSPEIRGDLTIIAPYRFRVSLNGVNWFLSVPISHTSGHINSTQIFVKFTKGSEGTFVKNIVHYTKGNSVGIQVTGVCTKIIKLR